MAQQIGGRAPLQRNTVKPRRQFLAEATAAGQAVVQILQRSFGPQPWIEQIEFAVKSAVQNGIENLSGSSISSNAHPEDGYRYRARTKEELLASQHLVADARDVIPTKDVLDPAAELAEPEPAPSPKASSGWVL